MGIVLAIANQKGGVGKTTTAINLAASLAAAERSVLLVDLDSQGNATSGLGATMAGGNMPGTYEVLLGLIKPEAALIKGELDNLHILPGSENLAAAEVELAADPERHLRLREALREIRQKYDYILIDCPPSLGTLTINALFAADKVLVPLQCEYFAMEGLAKLLATMDMVCGAGHAELSIIGILLTMFDARVNLSHQVASEVKSHFPAQVFETIIPRNVRLSEAPSFGKPIIFYDINSSGAKSYLELAQEVIQRVEEAPDAV